MCKRRERAWRDQLETAGTKQVRPQVRANGTGARGAFVPGERREDTATVEEEEKEGEEQRVGMK